MLVFPKLCTLLHPSIFSFVHFTSPDTHSELLCLHFKTLSVNCMKNWKIKSQKMLRSLIRFLYYLITMYNKELENTPKSSYVGKDPKKQSWEKMFVGLLQIF